MALPALYNDINIVIDLVISKSDRMQQFTQRFFQARSGRQGIATRGHLQIINGGKVVNNEGIMFFLQLTEGFS